MEKRILNCSITGSIHTPSMSEYLPYKPADIAQQAIDAANAGASTVHLHVRNPETGQPSSDLNLFGEVIDRIRTNNKEVVICLTTGGGFGMTLEERLSVVPKFKPELASFNCGSINWGLFPLANRDDFKFDWEKDALLRTKDFVFTNTFLGMEQGLKIMNEHNVKPEFECYDVGHIYNLKFMMDSKWYTGKPYIQFVMGINGGIGSHPEDLLYLKKTADRLLGVGNYNWSAFGAGKAEFPICTQNLFLGGHVRVGLEDNLYLAKGVKAKNNAELVEKMVRLMKEYGYEPSTPAETRETLEIASQ